MITIEEGIVEKLFFGTIADLEIHKLMGNCLLAL